MREPRILLAENNPEHSAELQHSLQLLHYSVEVHASGLTTLRRLQEPNAPEMALLSSALSPITGMEIALEIRRRSRRRQHWLMLISATTSSTPSITASVSC